jgi:hypothetical protein
MSWHDPGIPQVFFLNKDFKRTATQAAKPPHIKNSVVEISPAELIGLLMMSAGRGSS